MTVVLWMSACNYSEDTEEKMKVKKREWYGLGVRTRWILFKRPLTHGGLCLPAIQPLSPICLEYPS